MLYIPQTYCNWYVKSYHLRHLFMSYTESLCLNIVNHCHNLYCETEPKLRKWKPYFPASTSELICTVLTPTTLSNSGHEAGSISDYSLVSLKTILKTKQNQKKINTIWASIRLKEWIWMITYIYCQRFSSIIFKPSCTKFLPIIEYCSVMCVCLLLINPLSPSQ